MATKKTTTKTAPELQPTTRAEILERSAEFDKGPPADAPIMPWEDSKSGDAGSAERFAERLGSVADDLLEQVTEDREASARELEEFRSDAERAFERREDGKIDALAQTKDRIRENLEAADSEPEDVELDGESESDELEDENAEPDAEDEYAVLDNAAAEDLLGDTRIQVIVDGQAQDVPFSELVRGYSGQAATTKRFQEAASLRKEADEALMMAANAASEYASRLEMMSTSLTPEQKQELQQAQQARAETYGQLFTRVQAETIRAAESGSLIPGWENPETRQSELNAMADYARSLGFTEQAIAAVCSPAEIRLLHDAWRGSHGVMEARSASRPTKGKGKQPLRPGGKSSLGENKTRDRARKQLEAARNRLRMTGRPEDAIPALRQALGDDWR